MQNTLSKLLHSRKVLLAVAAVIQTLVLHYMDIPDEVWQSINVVIGLVIAGIAVEDAAEKVNHER